MRDENTEKEMINNLKIGFSVKVTYLGFLLSVSQPNTSPIVYFKSETV